MSTPPIRPVELKVVALLILFWSLLHLALDVHRWGVSSVEVDPMTGQRMTSYGFPMDLSDFGWMATIGLWRQARGGRTTGLVFSWYWLIGGILLLLQLYPIGAIRVISDSSHLAVVPLAVQRGLVFPFLLSQLWQLHYLNRADTRERFRKKPNPPALPPRREHPDGIP